MTEICKPGARCEDCPLPNSVASLTMDEKWLELVEEANLHWLNQMHSRMDLVEVDETNIGAEYLKILVSLAQLRVASGICQETPVTVKKEII